MQYLLCDTILFGYSVLQAWTLFCHCDTYRFVVLLYSGIIIITTLYDQLTETVLLSVLSVLRRVIVRYAGFLVLPVPYTFFITLVSGFMQLIITMIWFPSEHLRCIVLP